MEREGGSDIALALWAGPDRLEGALPPEKNILVFSEDSPDSVHADALMDHLFRTKPTADR